MMSCSQFDLKSYVLRELPEAERREVERHAKTCDACRGELDALLLTEAALFSLRDEEIPKRIAFVSDKVFEPSPWRRWLAAFWNSAPRLGFASAGMLSAAILISALTRPDTPAQPSPAPPPATMAQSAAPQADVKVLIQAAVEKALTESEARQQQMVAAIMRRAEEDRRQLAAAEELNRYLERSNNKLSMDAAGYRRGGLE